MREPAHGHLCGGGEALVRPGMGGASWRHCRRHCAGHEGTAPGPARGGGARGCAGASKGESRPAAACSDSRSECSHFLCLTKQLLTGVGRRLSGCSEGHCLVVSASQSLRRSESFSFFHFLLSSE